MQPASPDNHPARRIRREQPGVQDVGLLGRDQPLQSPERERVEFPPLAEHRHPYPVPSQLVRIQPAARQRDDVNLKLLAREPTCQHRQLLLGPRLIERRNQQQNFQTS